MPKHYAVGENAQNYTVTFDNTKTVVLTFDKPFTYKPRVVVTGDDSGAMSVYKKDVTTTDCTLRCQANWTGSVDVLVMQRKN